MYFNDYRNTNFDPYTSLNKIKSGLDVKYKNNTDPEARFDGGNARNSSWSSKLETLKFDSKSVQAAKLDSLLLSNSSLLSKLRNSIEEEAQIKVIKSNNDNKNKAAADM